LLHFLCELR